MEKEDEGDIEKVILNLSISSGIIKDEDGRIIPLDEAKRLWKEGKVTGYNRYFNILTKCNFDVEKTKVRFKGWEEEK